MSAEPIGLTPGGTPARHGVYGPSALGGGARRFWSLTFMLARTEFKLRFFGSILGYVWTLMRPLLFFGVILLVFTKLLNVGASKTPYYAQYLLMAIILFTYFQEATGNSVQSLVGRESMLRKVRFPRMAVPMSVSMFCLFNLGMNLIVVFAFILGAGIEPRWTWLELIPLTALLVVLATSVGMLLSALYVRYRDVQPIWEVCLQLLWYGSPILYTVQTAAHRSFFGIPFSRLLMINPIGAILTQARYAVIDPNAPTAAEAIGGTARLLIPLGIIAVMLVIGLWYFKREAPHISERL